MISEAIVPEATIRNFRIVLIETMYFDYAAYQAQRKIPLALWPKNGSL